MRLLGLLWTRLICCFRCHFTPLTNLLICCSKIFVYPLYDATRLSLNLRQPSPLSPKSVSIYDNEIAKMYPARLGSLALLHKFDLGSLILFPASSRMMMAAGPLSMSMVLRAMRCTLQNMSIDFCSLYTMRVLSYELEGQSSRG